MESSPARACPSCSAPARLDQRWCLECGAELGASRRGVGPAAGIAVTLLLLVSATSAGGYGLLQDGKQPPPPPTTVAQTPPPAALPPATEEPAPYIPPSEPAPLPPSYGSGSIGGTSSSSTTTTGGGSSGGGAEDGTNGGNTRTDDEDEGDPSDEGGTGGSPDEPQLTPVDVALGAVAVPYAPYAGDDVDLGDASRVVDGAPKTAWKTPSYDDPATHPQLGVYVDLASREVVRRLVVRTATPGMSIEVYGARKGPPASIVDDGWRHLATRAAIEQETKVKLPDRPFRYLLVWITGLPPDGGRAAINELSLISLQPE